MKIGNTKFQHTRYIRELIKAGSRVGWSFWSLVMPRGSGLVYNYVSVDYFSEFTKIGTDNYTEAYKKVYPDKDWNMMSARAEKLQNLVNTELWELYI